MEEFKDAMLPERDPRYLTVKEVVYHLTQCNQDVPGISEINWVIHVVDSPDVNAFVLPVSKYFKIHFLFLAFMSLSFTVG